MHQHVQTKIYTKDYLAVFPLYHSPQSSLKGPHHPFSTAHQRSGVYKEISKIAFSRTCVFIYWVPRVYNFRSTYPPSFFFLFFLWLAFIDCKQSFRLNRYIPPLLFCKDWHTYNCEKEIKFRGDLPSRNNFFGRFLDWRNKIYSLKSNIAFRQSFKSKKTS